MWFLLTSLAVYRVVRLWLHDTITDPLRDRVIGFTPDGRSGVLMRHPNRFTMWLVDLLSCQWCLGVWVSALAVAALVAADLADFGSGGSAVVAALVTVLALAAAQSLWHVIEDALLGNDD